MQFNWKTFWLGLLAAVFLMLSLWFSWQAEISVSHRAYWHLNLASDVTGCCTMIAALVFVNALFEN